VGNKTEQYIAHKKAPRNTRGNQAHSTWNTLLAENILPTF